MRAASAFMISLSFHGLQVRYSLGEGRFSLLQAPAVLLHRVAEMQTPGRQGQAAFL